MAPIKTTIANMKWLIFLFLATAAQAGEINGYCYQPDPLGNADPIKVEIQLRQLKAKGINAVCFAPPAYEDDVDSPRITAPTQLPPEMEASIVAAKRLEMTVVIKPSLFFPSLPGNSASWRGAVHMNSEEDWHDWFEHYERMISQYAGIAQRLHADLFVVGTQYDKATLGRDRQWRKVIRAVRAIYKGQISYEANGVEEADRIFFWDALDLISVSLPERTQNPLSSYRSDLGLLSQRNSNKVVLATINEKFISYEVPASSDAPTAEP